VTAICAATRPSRSVQRRPRDVGRGALALERADEAALRGLEGRRQPGHEPGQQRHHDREASTRPSIRMSNATGIGIGRSIVGHEPGEPGREDEPAGRAQRRQQHALGQELANEPAAAGAERQADADLALPARRRAPAACWRHWRRR
jgi:hypothetical protein